MRLIGRILKDICDAGLIADATLLEVKIYLVMLGHADPETFEVDSSISELAADAGCSNRGRTIAAMSRLEAKGFVEVIRKGGGYSNRTIRTVQSERLITMWRAHAAVHRAIRTGKLVRGPCEDCGKTENVHAHHPDYAKPLVVKWKCPKHHRAIHKRS